MKLLLLAITVFFFVSCQFNNADTSLQIVGRINQKESYPMPYLYNGPITAKIKKHAEEKVKFSFESSLVSHGQFVFLEYVKLKPGQLNDYENVTSNYLLNTAVAEVYDVNNHPISVKYDDVIGRTITINTQDRFRYQAKMTKMVLVDDQASKKAYYAAVVNLPADIAIHYAWANTSSRLNPFPFVKVENEEISNLAVSYFDSLAEFHIFKKQLDWSKTNYQYEETNVQIFDARVNEKYVLVQHNWIGDCEGMVNNYSALYHVTLSGWVLETEGSLDQFCIDLIDTDGDFYPELLMGDFASSSIYEINFEGFKKRSSISWSTKECNC